MVMATINSKNTRPALPSDIRGSFGPKAKHMAQEKLKRGKRKAQIELGGREETAKPATNLCSAHSNISAL